MLTDGRIFIAGVGTSLVSLAIVMALGQAASHEPRARRASPDLSSQLQPIVPAFAETPVTNAVVIEPATEVQVAVPTSAETVVTGAPELATEVPAETPVEIEKRPGIESPIKKTDLKRERSKRRAERRTKELLAHRARRAQQGLRVSKLLDER
jgi:hypothetical protein